MIYANLAIRFATELAGFAAVAYAGFQIDAPLPVRILAGVGGVLVVIGVWAAVVAPSNTNGLAPRTKDLIGTAILLGTAVMLARTGHAQLAIGFAGVVVLNHVLLVLLGTEPRERLASLGR
jgi:hypothetical protein